MSARVPLPPDALAIRVGVNDKAAPAESFEALGAHARGLILDLLPEGWSFEGKRVLDFGCGPGKVLRHFIAEAGTASFEGCDIHAPSVEWLRRELSPPITAFVNEEAPPLPRPDGSYDLIWAMSVFTHLVENSLDWLLELHRVLDEDGLMIASVLGRSMWETREAGPWEEERVGMAVVGHAEPWDLGGPVVYLSEWWLEEHWGRLFDIAAVKPGHAPGEHTLVLLRKRPVSLTRPELERFDPGDPREVAALELQVALLRRDVERLRARGEPGLGRRAAWKLRSLLR